MFAGTFDLEAGIFGGEAADVDVLDLVNSLVDKSILIREEDDASVRCRMLETLREYGRGPLADDESRSVQRRHRDWYERLVLRTRAEWIGPQQHELATRLDSEQPNVRAAMEFGLAEQGSVDATDGVDSTLRIAAALLDYWIVRGRLGEGGYWLDRALGQGGGSAAARLDSSTADCLLAALQRDVGTGVALAAQTRRLADDVSGARADGLASFADGVVAIAAADLPRGFAHLERAVAAFREEGDLERASTVYEEQLDITASLGGTMWRAMAMSDYGSALRRRGMHERGIAHLEEALRLLRLLDNRFGCAWAFEELAWATVDHDPQRAAVLMGAADAQFTATGSPMATFESLVACHDSCVAQARGALGGRAFAAATERGGRLGLDDAITLALGERPPAETPEPALGDDRLTRREWQVAELVAQGLTNKAIAEKLVISQRTAEAHVEHIRDKLGFSSRTQIATWLLQHTDEGAAGA